MLIEADQHRPICRRCARLKLQCQGFSPFPVFIDGLSLTEIQADNTTQAASGKELPLVPAPSLDEDNVFTTHLITSLFTAFQESNKAPNPNIISPWLMSSILPGNHNQAPQLAIRACAAAYFGKIHRQCSAVARGTVLYTQALRQLQKKLFDSEQVLKTDTLSATFLLALFEMITSKDMNGWSSHFLGIGHLVSCILVKNKPLKKFTDQSFSAKDQISRTAASPKWLRQRVIYYNTSFYCR